MDKTIRDHEQSQNNFLSIWRTFSLSHHINQINHIQTLLLISLEEVTMILSWDLGVCFHNTYTKDQYSYNGYDQDILVDLRMQRLFVSTSLKDHNDDYKKRRYWKDFTINESRDQNFLFWKKYGMLHKLYDIFHTQVADFRPHQHLLAKKAISV